VVGKKLGHYKILEKLASGGMGDVYVAEDITLGRKVALKVLPAEVADSPERRERFRREARAVAALSHPNVLAIHDFGEDQGVTFAVTELLEGKTLRERLDEGSMSPVEAMEYARQTADGLGAAHSRGIVHRDLKPENLFITKGGKVKILDFGLAKLSEEGGGEETPTQTRATEPGTIMGTVGYMSPEQVRWGRSVTCLRSKCGAKLPTIARMSSPLAPSCTRCCRGREHSRASRRP
jgi:serine/threonine protein kinase